SENATAVLGVAGVADIASGRVYAQKVEADAGQSRFDAVTQGKPSDDGAGVAYQGEYAFRKDDGGKVWIEDIGRWFAGPDGKPARAHGVIRAIDARHERERKLIQLAQFDSLTGEANRARLIELLGGILDEAVRFRTSCGFLLIAIDHLGRLNEAYGFDVTEQVIAQLAKRIHPKLRGEDRLGRFSGNKFGVVLKTCTPEELSVAAERLLAAVRDEPMETNAGPVAITVTIGGVTAPRHARTVQEIFSRAQDALNAARAKRHGSFAAYRPNVERAAQGKRARDRRDRRRAQRPPHRARLRAGGCGAGARDRLLRMPDARQSPRRHDCPCQRNHPGGRAGRAGAHARPPHARAGGAGARRNAVVAGERERLTGLHHRSRLVGGAWRAAARARERRRTADYRDHRNRGDPERRRH